MGKAVAERALEKGIKDVSFDRSGFQYHGRVQALADAAREAGLQLEGRGVRWLTSKNKLANCRKLIAVNRVSKTVKGGRISPSQL